MLPSTLTLAGLAPLGFASVSALATAQLHSDHPGYLSLPASRSVRYPGIPHLESRQADTNVPLYNESVVSYLVLLSIGTPGQEVEVAIDTGSSELWVDPNCNAVRDASQIQGCLDHGQYDPSQSSSAKILDSTNTIPYGIGTVRIGYVRDDVSLPNSTIDLQSIQFGVATQSKDLNEGILGLSFGGGTEQVNLRYNNFVDQLFTQNVTKARAFTVALGSADANNGGVIIFGGIDTNKFVGDLQNLPILPPQLGERLHRYWVTLESVGTTNGDDKQTYSDSNTPIVLDSGSTLCTLPSSIIRNMVDTLGGQIDSQGNVNVPCDQQNVNATFDFNFGNVTIQVPYYDFILEYAPDTCILAAMESSGEGSVSILGDSFMRSAYTVFDQDNMMVSMAQYANCGQEEMQIPAGGIGKVKGACSMSDIPSMNRQGSAGARAMAGWTVLISAVSIASFALLV